MISLPLNQSASRSVDQPVTQTAETDIQSSQSVTPTDKQIDRQSDGQSVGQSVSQKSIIHYVKTQEGQELLLETTWIPNLIFCS